MKHPFWQTSFLNIYFTNDLGHMKSYQVKSQFLTQMIVLIALCFLLCFAFLIKSSERVYQARNKELHTLTLETENEHLRTVVQSLSNLRLNSQGGES